MRGSPGTVHHPAAAGTTSARPGARDPLLDGLRSVALLRVLLWHALAWPWLSWVFPAMPVMFFLAGSLLATSLARGRALATVLRRARRLLVPFWAFAVVVLATTALTSLRTPGAAGPAADPAAADADLDAGGLLPGTSRLLRWVLPLVPPEGAAGQQGWLTDHLWYVSDYLWLLLLAPLLLRCARRPLLTLVVALAGLSALELGPLLGGWTPAGALRTAAGDVLCFGTSAVLGVAWAHRERSRRERDLDGRGSGDGVPARTRAALLVGGVTAVGVALALTRLVPLERGSLNASPLLLTVAALGWLLVVGAFADPLRRWAAGPRTAALTRAVTARAVTIYLWHPAAIVLARTLLDEVAPGVGPVASVVVVLVLTVAGTALAVVCAGWLEDVAGARWPRWWPARGVRPVAGRGLAGLTAAAATSGAAATVALAVAFTGGPSPSLLAIPGPSDRSALGQSAFATTEDPADVVPVRARPLTVLPTEDLQRRLDEWVAATDGIDAASVGVASGRATWDVVWEGTSSVTVGEGLPAGQPVLAASLTKGVTSALVLQEAVRGTLDLDAPVPPVDGVAPLPDGTVVTPRDLLHHASGLVQYADAPGHDAATVYDPAQLVSLATAQPLLFPPGTAVSYSNSGYLWLGLLLEQVTGTPYADLVAQRIAGPLGLTTMALATEPVPGWVGFSSGGVTASPGDLARFEGALTTSDLVLDEASRAQLLDLEPLTTGLGVWPFCPCGTDDDGRAWAQRWGQVVNSGGALSYPEEHVAVMAYLQPEGPRATEVMPDLAEALAAVLPGREWPTGR